MSKPPSPNTPPKQMEVGFAVRYVDDRQVNFVVVAKGVQKPLIDLKIGPGEAAVLGRALIAASAVCNAKPPKPASGGVVLDCQLPVLKWETGTSNINQAPVMRVTVPGGLQLTFEVSKHAARELGAALASEADRPEPPKAE